jgi:hypothetical protein
LNIIKVYVEKREHLTGGAAAIIDQLIVNSVSLKQEVNDFLKYHKLDSSEPREMN